MKRSKKIIPAIFLSLVLMAAASFCGAVSAYSYGSGSGSQNDPYVITTADDLKGIRDDPDACYVLGNDIDVSSVYWTPIPQFAGRLDGKDHTVSGLYVNRLSDDTGLFSVINYATVENLTVSGEVSGEDNVGLLCGVLNSASLKNITVYGTVEGKEKVGGICGSAKGSFDGCVNYADVTGTSFVGGIAGAEECIDHNPNEWYTAPGYMFDCKNYGTIVASGNYAGGITGKSFGNSIERCGNFGEVTASEYAGGIAGFADILQQFLGVIGFDDEKVYNYDGVVRFSFNTAEITAAHDNLGGILGGSAENYKIYNSYNAGKVVLQMGLGADCCGGIAPTAICTNCYNTGDLSWPADPISEASCQNCFYLNDVTSYTEGTSHKTAEEFKNLAKALGSAYENNAVLQRPIIKSNREAEFSCPHIMTYHPAKEMTCTEDGNPAYYSCSNDCGKNYADEAGTTEITEVLFKAPGHHYVLADSEEARAAGVEGSGYYVCLNCFDTSIAVIDGMTGEGTEEKPYVFETPESLAEFIGRYNAGEETFDGAYFKLGCDITDEPLSEGIGNLSHPFTGYFDGCGHKVKIDMEDTEQYGVFGTTKNAAISNLIVFGEITNTGMHIGIGALIGLAQDTSVTGCASDVNIISTPTNGMYIGGLVGMLVGDCSVSDCLVTGDITAKAAPFGGIGGYVMASGTVTFDRCLFTGEFLDCISASTIIGVMPSGGICGTGTVTNSYFRVPLEDRDEYKAYNVLLSVDKYQPQAYDEEGISGDFTKAVEKLGEAYLYDAETNIITLIPCGYMTDAFKPVWDGVKYDGVSLTLSSDISLNFYMELPIDNGEEGGENGTMVFTVGGREIEAEIGHNENGDFFACSLNVLEMAETVTAAFTYNGETYRKSYSVKDYVGAIADGTDENGVGYSEEAKTLARRIANYGHYAQIYLAALHSETVKLGEDGYAVMDGIFGENGEYDIDAENAKSKLSDDFGVTSSAGGYSLYGRTVYFDSATALNYYVTAADGEAPAASCEGKTVTVKKYAGRANTFIVTVTDIKATELDTDFAVTVGSGFSLKGSVLDYCGAVIRKEGQTAAAVNAMAALYEYSAAAQAYADAQ